VIRSARAKSCSRRLCSLCCCTAHSVQQIEHGVLRAGAVGMGSLRTFCQPLDTASRLRANIPSAVAHTCNLLATDSMAQLRTMVARSLQRRPGRRDGRGQLETDGGFKMERSILNLAAQNRCTGLTLQAQAAALCRLRTRGSRKPVLCRLRSRPASACACALACDASCTLMHETVWPPAGPDQRCGQQG